jgi:formiminoglutamase
MSGGSSSPAEWWSGLDPVSPDLTRGRGDPEDLRLGDVVRRWEGGAPKVQSGQPILVGFPSDEGVRRNGGRPGSARAPDRIREFLYRLTAWDGVAGVDLADSGLLDMGNVHVDQELEQVQQRLGVVVAALLRADAVPIVLGGGHETTYGHFLGYVGATLNAAIINVDAHLDVRPYPNGAHSGSPFRQALEHADRPVTFGGYAVIGAQRQSVAKSHAEFVLAHGGRLHWLPALASPDWPLSVLAGELENMEARTDSVLLTVDADAFRQSHVPGTSAPSPVGLDGATWPEIAYLAGRRLSVRSIDLVEVNPAVDPDGQSSRWAALGIRQFLVGLAERRKENKQRVG